MSSDRERIIEFDASTSIPADGWFAIDSTTEGTRKIQKSAIIGSGSLDTTSQEVIGAINEVNQRAATIDSMTQDEYDDLPSTKESDNVPRFITDGVPTFDETLWNKVGTDPLDTTAQDCSGAINEIKSSLSNLHMGTMTKTFTNGYCEIATSDFGMSIKPTALVMTPCNQIIVMRYDYDGSSNSIVKVYVGNNYSGLLRFCYWAK